MMTSKSAKASKKFNEQINQFLSAGNGPAGMAVYQTSIVRPHQAPELMHRAFAGNAMAARHLNVMEGFLRRERNKSMLCGIPSTETATA
jgi:hypothetical protein